MEHNQRKSIVDMGEVSTARLETLVDGVFAIAMTILVLDIHVPDLLAGATSNDLFTQLVAIWPRILSFILTFIILGMFWAGHHTEFRYIKKLDNKLIWLNIFYLMFVSFLPFTAALLGRYPLNQAAVIIYGIHLMIMVLVHYIMWQHASKHRNLVVENLDPRINKIADRLIYFSVPLYGIAILLSFWRIEASLIIYAFLPLPYIFGWTYKLA
ncbi:MAG TPA: TMEM175 family protein [Candidatus Limnocylindria bacterium]|nr:TMEM175 family protein [Candidatus Limnocylindria bacterium]